MVEKDPRWVVLEANLKIERKLTYSEWTHQEKGTFGMDASTYLEKENEDEARVFDHTQPQIARNPSSRRHYKPRKAFG